MLELKTEIIDESASSAILDLHETERLEIKGSSVNYYVNDHLNRTFDYSLDGQQVRAALITTFDKNKKAIVVILDDIGYIYYVNDQNNDTYIVNIPFSTKSAWSSPKGIYLERLHADSEDDGWPRIFCLNGPLDELSLIRVEGKKKLSAHDTIVYIVNDIVLTHNEKEKRLSFWRSRFSDTNAHTVGQRSRGKRRSSVLSKDKLSEITRSESLYYSANDSMFNKFEEEGFVYSSVFSHIESFPMSSVSSFDSIIVNGVLVIFSLVKELQKAYMMIFRLVQGKPPYFLDSLQLHATNIAALKSKHFQKIVVLSAKGKVTLESPMSPSLTLEGTFCNFSVRGASLYLMDTQGKQRYLSVDRNVSNSLVNWSFTILRHVLPLREYEIFYTGYLFSLFTYKLNDDEAFFSAVLACFFFFSPIRELPKTTDTLEEAINLSSLIHFKKEIEIAILLSSEFDYSSFKQILPLISLSLHFISEELRLDVTAKPRKDYLVSFLYQLSHLTGWVRFAEYYELDVSGTCKIEPVSLQIQIQEPNEFPSIYKWMIECLYHQKISSFYSPEVYGLPCSCYSLFTQSYAIFQLFDCLFNDQMSLHNFVEEMVRLGITRNRVERYPSGIASILYTILDMCAYDFPGYWGSEELQIVNRLDVDCFLHPKKSNWFLSTSTEENKDIRVLTNSVTDFTLNDLTSAHAKQSYADMIYREDRRLAEVEQLLCYSKQISVMTDQFDIDLSSVTMQQKLAQSICIRSLAIPIGTGMLTYGTKNPLPTERISPLPFKFTVHLHPGTLLINPDKDFVTSSLTEWPEFHVGVSQGLTVSRSSKEVNTSWIMFNRPTTLSPFHAGFLLGLGLNGHLKELATWHSFIYLTSKHDITSIGLLLGLSVSYLGTMDAKVTKLLSVHVLALLPMGSSELNISPLTQTAGILGIGLLFYDSCHRRMSEITMEEILTPEQNQYKNEGYKLSAGFALGLINLGKGSNLPGMADLKLVSRLQMGISSQPAFQSLETGSPGAIMALVLIYLKTNDVEIASKVDIPKSRYLLDFYRPDIILLRVLGKNLIMWDEVKADFEWVKSQIPEIMISQFDLREKSILSSDDLLLYNVISGICFSLGLRFVGTGNLKAKEILINFLDNFIRLCRLPAKTYDERVTSVTVVRCTHVVALSVACVMAGYCDLEALQRLRLLHGRIEPANYGAQMATHMALGILTLGEGRYSLSHSNLAIAALLVSLYPQFAKNTQDNHSHLQASRNLWVLAVEERCLIPRDQETKKPCVIPMKICHKNGTIQNFEAPGLLPCLDSIHSITTLSSKHWRLNLDFDANTTYRDLLQQSQILTLVPYDDTDPKSESSNLLSQIDKSTNPIWDLVKTSSLFEGPKNALNQATQSKSRTNSALSTKLSLTMSLNKLSNDQLTSVQILLQFFKSCWNGILKEKFQNRQYSFLSREFVEDLSLRVWELVHAVSNTNND
ncbi:anaphase-promoting complex, platform subcomplex scaffold subunit Apc1 [Schizosaccharomyces osmophilus]|uniref:Anaphase-promoting complex, platform subcomplex scaffold subunit Apc1 n=1 Tax=Schizosaccharomyces osmophilus TaxID=2545709 RepID=A0AAF0AZY9_9SCHI|nr:anaphase-promoting complex, platform subcomplex scaffold subunit Apc1 [Schizosaccharomyces osmophilus]WBW75499.1 anaphase-promoting complex, platform subcomplex scaffold subunit Apc1 [Schizosaccharomyces osmophilus]